MRARIPSKITGWIDGHAHLADRRIGDHLPEVLVRSRAAGVTCWIQGGVDPEDWERQYLWANKYPQNIFPTYGIHPWWVSSHSDEQCDSVLRLLEEKIADGTAVGLGELGLDFIEKRLGSDPEASKARQLAFFERQLALALKLDFPIVLHIVHAHGPAIELLKRVGVPRSGGLVHSYSGSEESVRDYVGLGLAISVSGNVTHKGFGTLKKAVVSVPAESLIIETDSPDQAPEGFAGPLGGNEPASLMRIAQAVGALRGESPQTILERSRANLIGIFGVQEEA